MTRRERFAWVVLLTLPILLFLVDRSQTLWEQAYLLLPGGQTVETVVENLHEDVRKRLEPILADAGLPYPPDRIAFLVFKQEKMLELWALGRHGWTWVHTYPILGASGGPGPKLREGDLQVPEGIYYISALHPNSDFHLSLKLNYPNEFDRKIARLENRSDLGGDIFIHGGSSSVGCVAVGNQAIEELFVLAAQVGIENVEIVMAPLDFRRTPEGMEAPADTDWRSVLYADIKSSLQAFPLDGQRVP